MTHDPHHICFLHKSGMFLEVLKDYAQVEYTEEEQKLLKTIAIHLYFEKETNYEVVVGVTRIDYGTIAAGSSKKIEVNTSHLNESVYPIESTAKLTPDQQRRFREMYVNGVGKTVGHHIIEVRTLIDGRPRTYMIIDILKGYRVIKRLNPTTLTAELFLYERYIGYLLAIPHIQLTFLSLFSFFSDRLYIKGILECKTKFNNKLDADKQPSSYIPRELGKGEICKGIYELNGLIDETFGPRLVFGTSDETQHRARPHIFPSVTISVDYPERYNKFLAVDAAQIHTGKLSSTKLKKFEWIKSFDFSS